MRATLLSLALLAPPAMAVGEDPAQLMSQLEARVLAAKRVSIEVGIEAQGAVVAKLDGRSELRDRNRAELSYAGEFAGKPVALALRGDGRTLTLGSGEQRRVEPLAAETNRALLVGLLRMGQLHNLARLTGLQTPDRASGGVEQWVALDAFRPTTFAQGGDLEGFMSFGYDLVVDGQPSASVRLWLDPVTELPRRRQVIVRFAQGDMIVLEDYRKFELE